MRHAHDAALYRGSFAAVLASHDSVSQLQQRQTGMSFERAELAERKRRLLRAAASLEEWGVALARWTLEAAMTGHAQPGTAAVLFQSCRTSLQPPVPELLDRVRLAGHVHRADVSRAIGQCAAHHGLWASLSSHDSDVDEFNRFYWTPLHFALAFGSPQVVIDLLALAPRSQSAPNALGLSPLHVGVYHGAVEAVAALASGGGDVHALDRQRRSPTELALEVAASVGRCRKLLAALGTARPAAARRRCKEASVRRRRRASSGHAHGAAARPPPACTDDGGWGGEPADVLEGGLREGGLREGGLREGAYGLEDGAEGRPSAGGGVGGDEGFDDGDDDGAAAGGGDESLDASFDTSFGASFDTSLGASPPVSGSECGIARLTVTEASQLEGGVLASQLIHDYLGLGVPVIVSAPDCARHRECS